VPNDVQQQMDNDEDNDGFHDDDDVHGNSLDSNAPAQGYVLVDKDTGGLTHLLGGSGGF